MAIPFEQKEPFLPPGARPVKAAPPSRGSDREKDPRVARDRSLGDYGWKLVDSIYKDYEAQIKVWKNAFKDVTAAYATSVDMRIKTFNEVKEQLKADAERSAFIFSLLAGGGMVCLGAWVQYAVIPRFTMMKPQWDFSKGLTAVPGLKFVKGEMFSKMQAAMFGGIVKDVGGKAIPHLFPAPPQKSYPMDQPSVAANMDADFGKFVDDSAEVVLQQLRDVQIWMNEGTEFGEAWLTHAKGNAGTARTLIRVQLDKLRNRWADEWEFFGKTPVKITRPFLADQFERAFWADYIHELLDRVMVSMDKNRSLKPRIDELEKAGLNKLEQLEELQEDWRQGIGHHTWIEAPIVNRLKELNVVFAETQKGSLDQANRMTAGESRPEVRIKGGVDRGKEIDEIYGWADFFLAGMSESTARRFFPPAKRRTLEPFPAYQ